MERWTQLAVRSWSLTLDSRHPSLVTICMAATMVVIGPLQHGTTRGECISVPQYPDEP